MMEPLRPDGLALYQPMGTRANLCGRTHAESNPSRDEWCQRRGIRASIAENGSESVGNIDGLLTIFS
jgi:hypothetical protein